MAELSAWHACGICNEAAVLKVVHSIVPVLGESSILPIRLVLEHDLGIIPGNLALSPVL